MANNGYRKKGRRKPPWSDLPTELMELVLQKCNFSDQARVRAICRRWKSIPRVQTLRQQLPWLMAYDDRNWSICKLFDLTYKRTYTINISNMEKYYKEKKPDQIVICASKSGWLLLCHPLCHRISHSAFLLYSPFTNSMIQLPNLQTNVFWVKAAFSADPTSADCVFFVLHQSNHDNTMAASICRLGDTTWTTHVFPGFVFAMDDVVYLEGLFWCSAQNGTLATFSLAQGIWNVLESPCPLPPLYLGKETSLVESSGNLLLVIPFPRRDKTIHVYKLDRSQMAWILIEDIGDQALFLGPPTSLSVSTVAGKLRASGKIHYRRGSKCRFFSWNSKRSYAYPKHYALLTKENHFLRKIWIEPPI